MSSTTSSVRRPARAEAKKTPTNAEADRLKATEVQQIQGLKAQEKEHRRSALIQDLRTQQREQDLLIDVLKQTLQEKVSEFQDSRALVNDFVLKKSAGGPMRFRPKTREELENELQALGQNFQRIVEKFKQDSQRNAAPKEEKPHDSDKGDGDEKTEEKNATNQNVAAGEFEFYP
ncbi:hypothetical protein JG687_00016708 [Phytophthora cactorum]|uniref:Uncharacterized protein n=1 Tax=Phytophthora cactorum TaxID=29920 RepID=A0A8T1TSH6_9STRA|nr:hypothetical protein JG687_00016708 [Phytophthora cactorum]